MPTKFYPTADRVLIKPEDTGGEKRSESGLIIIPDLGKTRSTKGIIVALGPEVAGIDIGDVVLFGKYAGADIELNHEVVTICRQEDVLGIIVEEPDETPEYTGSSDVNPLA
jgi:chaperonin GroES